MANQKDDEISAIDRLERDIAREIEEAFANVPYPGDDNLLRSSFSIDNDTVLEWFQGKHWKEISLRALRVNEVHTHLFAPEAFRFYLPCFMVGGLLHVEETNLLWDSVFSDLTPPESEGRDKDWFHAWVNLLDTRQKAAVRRYVDYYVSSYPNPDRKRALAFWQGITDPALLN